MTARQPSEVLSAVQHIAPVALTASKTDATAVDCRGYEWVRFVVNAGVIGASTNITVKIQESSDSGGSPDTFADVTSATTVQLSTSNDVAHHPIDIFNNSRERYMKAIITFDTGSGSSVLGVDCLRFHAGRDSDITDSNVVTVTAV